MVSKRIFSISTRQEFEKLALELFQYQYRTISVYKTYCDLLKVNVNKVTQITQIPFLPIQFFKSHSIIHQEKKPEITFSSSGTTGSITSKHLVAHLEIYEESFTNAFQAVYGSPEEWVILALLPSYLEREGSSLVYMVTQLIAQTKNPSSGFYLHDHKALFDTLQHLEQKEKKTLLIGVSYALLDFIEKYSISLKHTVVMETGGMKGRRKEIIKKALHTQLKAGFGIAQVHSEYGMTELLSQAYATQDGIFKCPHWMRVLTRDPEDPFEYVRNKTGGINVIDLANRDSCAFIATQDLGKVFDDHSFEILGRFDHSDLRGCNLMLL